MTGESVVLVTCPNDLSSKLARLIVEEGLAACVNIIPGITSVYVWHDKLCQEAEDLLIVKTTEARFDLLTKRIVEEHTYDIPEIVRIPIEDGFKPYLDWLTESCTIKKSTK